MAASKNKKLKMVRDLGLFFAEMGRVPSRGEYSKLKVRPKFMTVKEIDRICVSWTHMIQMLEKEETDLWSLIHKAPEPPPIVEPVAKAKPAKKAVKEGAYGESI
jgi:hypothetical protein